MSTTPIPAPDEFVEDWTNGDDSTYEEDMDASDYYDDDQDMGYMPEGPSFGGMADYAAWRDDTRAVLRLPHEKHDISNYDLDMWKGAVALGNTTASFEDWAQQEAQFECEECAEAYEAWSVEDAERRVGC